MISHLLLVTFCDCTATILIAAVECPIESLAVLALMMHLPNKEVAVRSDLTLTGRYPTHC